MSASIRRIALRAGHLVAFDGAQHRLLHDGVVVIEGCSVATSSAGSRPARRPTSSPGRQTPGACRVLAVDERAILEALQADGERMWPRMAQHDWAGRPVEELSPQTYEPWVPV